MDIATQPELEAQQPHRSASHGQRDGTGGPPNENNELSQPRVTRRQLFYLLVPQGIGAAIIDAVANFAIACAMYRTTRKEIRLWPLKKNTIAGDMGVTVIIQGILTTLIAGRVVHADVQEKRIEPFAFGWPDVAWWHKSGGKSKWKRHVGTALGFLSPTQTLSLRLGRREFLMSLGGILLRGFVISVIYFLMLWPLAIAITAPLYGRIDMRKTWKPEIIKAIFGGVLGLLMNPFVAALVLGSYASVDSESEVTRPLGGRGMRLPFSKSQHGPQQNVSTMPLGPATSTTVIVKVPVGADSHMSQVSILPLSSTPA